MADFRIEKRLLRQGRRAIAGVDEVGRGALFGPVVAAAVVFSPDFLSRRPPLWARRINDSKLLTPGARQALVRAIAAEAVALGLGSASSEEIDRDNIFRASQTAMKRALLCLGRRPDFVLVDGFPLKGVEYEQLGLSQGDRKSVSVAAASIVAKVFRDELMVAFDAVYEGYGLARNKGYGTEEHYRRLRERGPTGLHRLTFKIG